MPDAPTQSGGQPIVHPLPYDPPQGPANPPATNHGNCGTQGGSK